MEGLPTTLSDLNTVTGVLAGVLIVCIILLIALIVFYIVVTWKMYEQAGEKGWKSIIPFYNVWVLKDIAEVNWWWFLIAILSTIITTNVGSDSGNNYGMILRVGTILSNLVFYTNIAKKYGKDTGFGVLCALIPIVGLPILVFGNNTFDKNIEVPSNGIFGGAPLPKVQQAQTQQTAQTQQANVNSAAQFCPNCGTAVNGTMNNCPNCGKNLK